MKKPNGYGSVHKLSGKRRRPWNVRVTIAIVKEDSEYKQKYSNIGQYETRKEAEIALADYNKSPYDLNAKTITFSEVFDICVKVKHANILKANNSSALKNITSDLSMYKHLHPLHKVPLSEIKLTQLQAVFDSKRELSIQSLTRIKGIVNMVMTYALQYDLIQKDYSQFIKLNSEYRSKKKKPYPENEIELLWGNLHIENVDTVLIMIYTGLRVSELISLKNEDISLEKSYMTGGLKTKAGTGREIPIHKRIRSLIKTRISCNERLFYQWENADAYTPAYNKLHSTLNMNHTPHECRHTFATRMAAHKEFLLETKLIMGHKVNDITLGTYTHIEVTQLLKAVNLLM